MIGKNKSYTHQRCHCLTKSPRWVIATEEQQYRCGGIDCQVGRTYEMRLCKNMCTMVACCHSTSHTPLASWRLPEWRGIVRLWNASLRTSGGRHGVSCQHRDQGEPCLHELGWNCAPTSDLVVTSEEVCCHTEGGGADDWERSQKAYQVRCMNVLCSISRRCCLRCVYICKGHDRLFRCCHKNATICVVVHVQEAPQ